MLTGMWGKEIIDLAINQKDSLWMNYLEDIRKYIDLKNIPIENFDFYTDYTTGGICRESILQKTKNRIELRYD